MNLDRRMMRKVWAKAEMTEMMHWNLKRDLQLPLWNVKVKWMAQILLVRSQGGYHHALPLIGHQRLLKHSSVNQSLTLSTTMVSVVSSPFDQSLQKRGGILKIHALPTGVIPIQQDSSGTIRVNGWEFITIIGMMDLVNTEILWTMTKNFLLSEKDVLKNKC